MKTYFDPETLVIPQLRWLMDELPIEAALFSPDPEAKECWMVSQGVDGARLLHEDKKYSQFSGKFKKPDAGMLLAAMDIYGYKPEDTVFIGDMDVDEQAAKKAGVKFIHADNVHSGVIFS